MSIRRRILAVLGVTAVALAMALGPAGADPTGGANNIVIAQTSTDGATLVRASTQVVPVPGDTVTSANIADAFASDCVGCHSTAVAVQVLLITGNPSYFAPGNVASAVNGACTGC